MKQLLSHQHVEMIPVDKVRVINPRVRNRKQHREIVDSIKAIGLKRPITVSRKPQANGSVLYDLVCGQGRLEAFKMLRQQEIPAFVTNVSEAECFVMSLVENVARRQHRPIDLMREIGNLKDRGHSDSQIATKLGVTSSWVSMIRGLLERGEDRLLSAVETGLIPLSMATDIARSSEAEVQNLLAEAYEQGEMRGKKLNVIRRLLDHRAKQGKSLLSVRTGASRKSKPTATQVRELYEREVNKHRLVAKKASLVTEQLLFVTEAVKELMADEAFRKIVIAEKLDSMPKALKDRIAGEVT